jgi:hypothetical protein
MPSAPSFKMCEKPLQSATGILLMFRSLLFLHLIVMRPDCEHFFVSVRPYGSEIVYQFHVCLR